MEPNYKIKAKNSGRTGEPFSHTTAAVMAFSYR